MIFYALSFVPTVWAETWGLNAREKRRLNIIENKCLRSICGVTVRDRIRNEEIGRRKEAQVDLST